MARGRKYNNYNVFLQFRESSKNALTRAERDALKNTKVYKIYYRRGAQLAATGALIPRLQNMVVGRHTTPPGK